jgi:hypothetical protein
MKHLNKAVSETLAQLNPELLAVPPYISVDAHILTMKIQSDPIGMVGINGIQASDMLIFVKELFKSLNAAFPCRENALTITKLEEAMHWQEARTKDRVIRAVEGKNEE